MALSHTHSFQFSRRPKISHQTAAATTTPTSLSFLPTNPIQSLHHPPPNPLLLLHHLRRRRRPFTSLASENGSETPTADSDTAQQQQPQQPSPDGARVSEVGEEIKRMMKERAEKEGADAGLLSGVAEEVGEIEWPDFKKVVGTTGIVLGVIAGSSVVLLTVNAVLSELSDKVFAGKGVQDFFG